MQTLLRRIKLGIGTGAALALGGVGCSASLQRPDGDASDDLRLADAMIDSSFVERSDASTFRDATIDTGLGADRDAGGFSKDAATTVLPPFPLDLICTFEDAGACCYQPLCFAVAEPCPDADSPNSPVLTVLPYLPYCEQPQGPFAPNPDYPYWINEGNCCYVVAAPPLGDGRPFMAQNTHLVAPLIVRNDWLAA